MSRDEKWRHVPNAADVEYNRYETSLAIEKARAKWPGRPDCSLPLEFGYRWCTRAKVPAELLMADLEWRDIQVARVDERNRFIVGPDGRLAETKTIRVFRVPLDKPRAVSMHQGERAQDVLDGMRPLTEALPSHLLPEHVGEEGADHDQ